MNAIGVDVGGTKIAAAVVSAEGEILNEVRYPTQAVPPNRLVGTIAGAITEVGDGFEVGGVCLAVPGLIMASVFLAFTSGPDVIVKMFGLGLGIAILIDVLIVRMVVSPALMAVLGDRAWWMPRWLDRAMPNVSLEGGHDDRAERVTEREKVAA